MVGVCYNLRCATVYDISLICSAVSHEKVSMAGSLHGTFKVEHKQAM